MHRKAEIKGNESTTQTDAAGAAAHTRTAASGAGHTRAAEADAELDFESLDLSIETVEERISPSETNVFDK